MLRDKIRRMKGNYSSKDLEEMSLNVIRNLKEQELYKKSKTILLYYSMPDEVDTKLLIHTSREKNIVLPVVTKDGLVLKKYISEDDLYLSKYGINEPLGDIFVDYDDIDLVIVPGVAFDRSFNRMGRGMGYYDGLLPKINAPKVAICFDFQLIDHVPVDARDVKMDTIVCESEIIY